MRSRFHGPYFQKKGLEGVISKPSPNLKIKLDYIQKENKNEVWGKWPNHGVDSMDGYIRRM